MQPFWEAKMYGSTCPYAVQRLRDIDVYFLNVKFVLILKPVAVAVLQRLIGTSNDKQFVEKYCSL